MRSKWTVRASVVIALVLAVVLASTAGAGNFHFNSLSFSLGSLDMQGDLAGLGNEYAQVTLTAYGTVVGLCQNNGGKQAPGRNPIRINVVQTETFVPDQYGHALVQVSAEDPTLNQIEPSPTPKSAGCPNGNWSVVGVVDGSTDWTAARVVVKDSLGQTQINLSFTCTTTFQNGVGVSVKCDPA